MNGKLWYYRIEYFEDQRSSLLLLYSPLKYLIWDLLDYIRQGRTWLSERHEVIWSIVIVHLTLGLVHHDARGIRDVTPIQDHRLPKINLYNVSQSVSQDNYGTGESG